MTEAATGRTPSLVLENDQGFGDGLPRDGSMGRRADIGQKRAVGEGPLEKAELELDLEDAPDGLVEAGPLDRAFGDQIEHRVIDSRIRVGDHYHVYPGIDGRSEPAAFVARQQVHPAPVGDDEALEAELAAQYSRKEMRVTVILDAVP